MNNVLALSMAHPRFVSAALLISFLCAGCWPSDPEVYLIPEGYVGPVIVAFEQEDGQPVQREDGAWVYTIPPNGVLKTQAGFPDGFRLMSYYYVDDEGHRSRLPDHIASSDLPEDTTQVFNLISGYLGELVEPPGDTLVVYGGWSTDTRSPSLRFLVGKRSDWKRLASERDSVVSSITRTVISKPATADSSTIRDGSEPRR